MQSLKDKVYKSMKERIITCRIEPGAVIDEKALIKEFGVSRTPVREALSQLCNEELVVIVPRRGIFATQITLKNIMDLFEFNMEVEPFTVKLAAKNISKSELEYYMKVFSENQTPDDAKRYEYAVQDENFHCMIATCSKNTFVTRCYNNIRDHAQRIRIMANMNPSRIRNSKQEHREIIQYLLDGDAIGAAGAARIHAESSRKQALEFITFHQ